MDVVTLGTGSPIPDPNRAGPATLVQAAGRKLLVERTLHLLADDISYRLAHHADLNWDPPVEVTEVSDGDVADDGEVRIRCAPTDHAPVHPTIGFRIENDGAAVVVAGDTVPCPGLDRLCAGADVYVQTTLRRSLIEAVPVRRLQDILDYHSTIEDAATTAARAGVGTLVLTHLVPAPVPGTEHEWAADAKAIFAGGVVVADDLTTITTP